MKTCGCGGEVGDRNGSECGNRGWWRVLVGVVRWLGGAFCGVSGKEGRVEGGGAREVGLSEGGGEDGLALDDVGVDFGGN